MLKVKTVISGRTSGQYHKLTTDNGKVAYITYAVRDIDRHLIGIHKDLDWVLHSSNKHLTFLPEREITAMEDLELKDGYPYYLMIMPCDAIHEVEHIHPRVTLHSFEGHSEIICICKHEPEGKWSCSGSLTLDRLRPKHTFSIEYDDRKTKQRLMELAELLG